MVHNFLRERRPYSGFAVNLDEDRPLFIMRGQLHYGLSSLALRFKHYAFEQEEETRLIVNREYGDTTDLLFREVNGQPVPYLEIPFQPGQIVSVRCGPTHPQPKVKRAVEMMLDRFGYKNVLVTDSNIPLAF